MAVILLIIVAVVVAIWAVVAGFQAMSRYQRRTEAIVHEVSAHEIDALRYRLPAGQDPAAVIAALTHEGYTAVRDDHHDGADILVVCPAGVDRERAHVRAVIRHVGIDLEGHAMPDHEVRFLDEEQPT
jgi:hypothetical protein